MRPSQQGACGAPCQGSERSCRPIISQSEERQQLIERWIARFTQCVPYCKTCAFLDSQVRQEDLVWATHSEDVRVNKKSCHSHHSTGSRQKSGNRLGNRTNRITRITHTKKGSPKPMLNWIKPLPLMNSTPLSSTSSMNLSRPMASSSTRIRALIKRAMVQQHLSPIELDRLEACRHNKENQLLLSAKDQRWLADTLTYVRGMDFMMANTSDLSLTTIPLITNPVLLLLEYESLMVQHLNPELGEMESFAKLTDALESLLRRSESHLQHTTFYRDIEHSLGTFYEADSHYYAAIQCYWRAGQCQFGLPSLGLTKSTKSSGSTGPRSPEPETLT